MQEPFTTSPQKRSSRFLSKLGSRIRRSSARTKDFDGPNPHPYMNGVRETRSMDGFSGNGMKAYMSQPMLPLNTLDTYPPNASGRTQGSSSDTTPEPITPFTPAFTPVTPNSATPVRITRHSITAALLPGLQIATSSSFDSPRTSISTEPIRPSTPNKLRRPRSRSSSPRRSSSFGARDEAIPPLPVAANVKAQSQYQSQTLPAGRRPTLIPLPNHRFSILATSTGESARLSPSIITRQQPMPIMNLPTLFRKGTSTSTATTTLGQSDLGIERQSRLRQSSIGASGSGTQDAEAEAQLERRASRIKLKHMPTLLLSGDEEPSPSDDEDDLEDLDEEDEEYTDAPSGFLSSVEDEDDDGHPRSSFSSEGGLDRPQSRTSSYRQPLAKHKPKPRYNDASDPPPVLSPLQLAQIAAQSRSSLLPLIDTSRLDVTFLAGPATPPDMPEIPPFSFPPRSANEPSSWDRSAANGGGKKGKGKGRQPPPSAYNAFDDGGRTPTSSSARGYTRSTQSEGGHGPRAGTDYFSFSSDSPEEEEDVPLIPPIPQIHSSTSFGNPPGRVEKPTGREIKVKDNGKQREVDKGRERQGSDPRTPRPGDLFPVPAFLSESHEIPPVPPVPSVARKASIPGLPPPSNNHTSWGEVGASGLPPTPLANAMSGLGGKQRAARGSIDRGDVIGGGARPAPAPSRPSLYQQASRSMIDLLPSNMFTGSKEIGSLDAATAAPLPVPAPLSASATKKVKEAKGKKEKQKEKEKEKRVGKAKQPVRGADHQQRASTSSDTPSVPVRSSRVINLNDSDSSLPRAISEDEQDRLISSTTTAPPPLPAPTPTPGASTSRRKSTITRRRSMPTFTASASPPPYSGALSPSHFGVGYPTLGGGIWPESPLYSTLHPSPPPRSEAGPSSFTFQYSNNAGERSNVGLSPGHKVQPRDDQLEGREALPEYSNSIYLKAEMPRKMEFIEPGRKAGDRKWRRVICELEGTVFRVYRPPPPSTSVGATIGGWWERKVGVGDSTSTVPLPSTVAALAPASRPPGKLAQEGEDGGRNGHGVTEVRIPPTPITIPPTPGTIGQPTPSRSRFSGLLKPKPHGRSKSDLTGPPPVPRTAPASRSSFSMARPSFSSVTSGGHSSGNAEAPEPMPSRTSESSDGGIRVVSRTPASSSSHVSSSQSSLPSSQSQPPSQPSSQTSSSSSKHPPSDNPPLDPSDLIKAYTTQHSESGLANDYLKRKNVIRVRMEGQQFLLQAADIGGVVEWIEGLQSANNISLDLDERVMPKGPMFPRRRRRRPRRVEVPNSASTTGTGGAGSAPTSAATTVSERH